MIKWCCLDTEIQKLQQAGYKTVVWNQGISRILMSKCSENTNLKNMGGKLGDILMELDCEDIK